MRAYLYGVVSVLSACAGESFETFEIQSATPTPLDLLVVLDDTTAMASHLPRNPPPGQVTVPIYFYNGAPDVRIAVTTSTTGTLRTSSAVPTGIIEHRVRFEDGTLATNYSGTLIDAVGSLMSAGTSSNAPNAPLAATEKALQTSFARSSASLGIMISTAGDDESPGDVATYATTLHAKKERVALSVVYAEPGQRLQAYADTFANRRMTPASEYSMQAVEVFASLLSVPPPDACFPIATPDATGCQLFTSHEHVVTPLPMCAGEALGTDTACWQMIADGGCASGLAILLGGPYRQFHPQIFGRCPL